MDLKAFNAKLRELISAAKLREKSDPRASVANWIQVVELCLNFAKITPDRRLSLMVQKKAQSLVEKIKSIKEQQERGSFAATSSGLAEILPDLPSPPATIPSDGWGGGGEGDGGVGGGGDGGAGGGAPWQPPGGPTGDEASAGSDPKSTGDEEDWGASVDAEVARLEQIMSNLPAGMRAVSPKPYAGETIIPKRGASSSYDPEQARQLSFDLDGDLGADAGTSGFDPSKPPKPLPPPTITGPEVVDPELAARAAAKRRDEGIKPPATPPTRDPLSDVKPFEGPESRANSGTGTCFACGSPVPSGAAHCPTCGARQK
ncbi:MAG: hypothetical protein Kow0069_21000 [Promethearchaeota archaeon]